jgi:hypothetical protein
LRVLHRRNSDRYVPPHCFNLDMEPNKTSLLENLTVGETEAHFLLDGREVRIKGDAYNPCLRALKDLHGQAWSELEAHRAAAAGRPTVLSRLNAFRMRLRRLFGSKRIFSNSAAATTQSIPGGTFERLAEIGRLPDWAQKELLRSRIDGGDAEAEAGCRICCRAPTRARQLWRFGQLGEHPICISGVLAYLARSRKRGRLLERGRRGPSKRGTNDLCYKTSKSSTEIGSLRQTATSVM